MKAGNKAGLTMVEALMALLILGIIMVSFSGVLLASLNINRISGHKGRALQLARGELEELRSDSSSLSPGTSMIQGEAYRVEVRVGNYQGSSHLYLVEVKVLWESEGRGEELKLWTIVYSNY